MNIRRTALSVMLGLGLLGATVPAQAATLTDASNGTLQTRGVAVQGTYTITCTEGSYVFVQTELLQRVSGGRVAAGWDGDSFECTGGEQQVAYVVTAGAGMAFKNGPALLRVQTFECAGEFDYECMYEGSPTVSSQEIRLQKK